MRHSLTGTAAVTGLSAVLVPEAIVTVIGLISLWVIWALRDRPDAAGVAVASAAPGLPPLAVEATPPPEEI